MAAALKRLRRFSLIKQGKEKAEWGRRKDAHYLTALGDRRMKYPARVSVAHLGLMLFNIN